MSEQHGHMISRTDGACNVEGAGWVNDAEYVQDGAHRKNTEIGELQLSKRTFLED